MSKQNTPIPIKDKLKMQMQLGLWLIAIIVILPAVWAFTVKVVLQYHSRSLPFYDGWYYLVSFVVAESVVLGYSVFFKRVWLKITVGILSVPLSVVLMALSLNAYIIFWAIIPYRQ